MKSKNIARMTKAEGREATFNAAKERNIGHSGFLIHKSFTYEQFFIVS